MNRGGTRAIARCTRSSTRQVPGGAQLTALEGAAAVLICRTMVSVSAAHDRTLVRGIAGGDRRAGAAAAAVLAILLVQADLQAQGAGRIAGTVQDLAGNPLAGVVVALAGIPGLEASTDPQGRFVLEPVPIGEHVITATLEDVARGTRSVRVVDSETAVVALTLSIRIADVVIVTADKTGERDASDSAGGRQCAVESAVGAARGAYDRRSCRPGALGDVLSEHRLCPAHYPRHRNQCDLCRVGSELGGVPRWRLSRAPRRRARRLPGPGTRGSASRSSGNVVRPQRGGRRNQPHHQSAHERANALDARRPRHFSDRASRDQPEWSHRARQNHGERLGASRRERRIRSETSIIRRDRWAQPTSPRLGVRSACSSSTTEASFA